MYYAATPCITLLQVQKKLVLQMWLYNLVVGQHNLSTDGGHWPPKEFLVVKKDFSFQIWQMQNMVKAFAFIIMLLRMYFQISKLA